MSISDRLKRQGEALADASEHPTPRAAATARLLTAAPQERIVVDPVRRR